MWPELNVWIMEPGGACRVHDDKQWTVYVTDAHCAAFTWKGIDYTAGRKLGTPGHLAIEIPPGTYVVWAEHDKQDGLVTERAIAAVGCEGPTCVRLLTRLQKEPPDQPDEPDEPPDEETPGDCHVEIMGVRGADVARERFPRVLVVSGTATGCPELVVTVTGPGQHVEHQLVAVGGSGDWECAFSNEGLKAECDDKVVVEAVCESNRECLDKRVLAVECEQASGAG